MGLVFLWFAATAFAGEVWINELVPDPAGADAGQEWVELWASADASIEGWRIEAATHPDAWALVATLPSGTHLSAGVHLVVADGAVDVGEAEVVRVAFAASLGNAGADADAVRLVDAEGSVVDVLAYGADAAGLFPEASAHAVKPATDEAVARAPDGARHAEDVDPTPGGPNPTPTRCVPGLPGSVLLTEVQADPDGADAGAEWVELWVGEGRDLGGWSIEQAGSPADWERGVRFTFPEGAQAASGARWIVADADADVVTDWRLPRGDSLGLGNSEDAVRVVDCGGRPIDTLIYGGENLDGFAEDDGSVPSDAAPATVSGGCLARVPDDSDVDRSAVDWVGLGRCSPGDPNEVVTPVDDLEGAPSTGCSASTTPSRPGASRPGGCATGAPMLGEWVIGATLLILRRAERRTTR